MSGLLGLLIAIIIIALICYVVFWALAQIPLPEPVRVVITVLVALVILIIIVRQFNLLSGMGFVMPPHPFWAGFLGGSIGRHVGMQLLK
jgi:hypothetical protein